MHAHFNCVLSKNSSMDKLAWNVYLCFTYKWKSTRVCQFDNYIHMLYMYINCNVNSSIWTSRRVVASWTTYYYFVLLFSIFLLSSYLTCILKFNVIKMTRVAIWIFTLVVVKIVSITFEALYFTTKLFTKFRSETENVFLNVGEYI